MSVIGSYEEMTACEKHPNWNPETLRIELDAEAISKLEVKSVTPLECYDVGLAIDYNPTFLYPSGVEKLDNEAGHDSKYRYILIHL